MASEPAQELVVERRRRKPGRELGVDTRVVPLRLERVRVLVPEDELERAVLVALEAARLAERVAKLHVLAGRHRLEDGPLLEQHPLDVRDAREDLERLREPVGAHQRRRAVELVEQELDPQLAGVVLDDEQHLVVHRGYGSLRGEQLVEVQVVAVRPALVELDVDAGL
jgi:hypothetical protein